MTERDQVLQEELPAGPGVRILRREEAASWMEGYSFLEQARQAYASEHARGHAEGWAEGMKEASVAVAETAIKADRYLLSLETGIAGLAMTIVRRVLGEFDGAELIARMTLQALDAFRQEKALTITVNPRAVPEVSKALASHAGRLHFEFVYKIESDSELPLSTCRIATEFEVLEASLDAQLHALSVALTAAAEGETLEPFRLAKIG
jgi:type III secretion protein L